MAKQRTPCLTKDVLRGRHVLLIRNPLEFLVSMFFLSLYGVKVYKRS
jgi:hypothetical protein